MALLHSDPVGYVYTSCLLSLLNMSEGDFNKTHELCLCLSIWLSCVCVCMCVCVSQLLFKPDELTTPSTSSSLILMRLEVTWGFGGGRGGGGGMCQRSQLKAFVHVSLLL